MVTIIFESHGTTIDNEAHRSSGAKDVELSELGRQQAKELGARYEGQRIDAVFCSVLKRSYETAAIAFEGTEVPVIRDARLNECDYGDMNGTATKLVDPEKAKRITVPFPNGESYEQCAERMRSFLDDLAMKYENRTVVVIGHRATQYGLEHWINDVPLKDAVAAPWAWQPGWTYRLDM